MKDGKLLDLYSDYLISALGQTTATGLSTLLNGEVSHDQVQRSLAGEAQTSVDVDDKGQKIPDERDGHGARRVHLKYGLST
jgi:hypothetical protein